MMGKRGFPGFGGPAELAASVPLPFAAHQIPIRPPDFVAQPDPGEVEEFMGQNARELIGPPVEFAIQYDFAPSDIASGVNRLSAFAIGIKLPASDRQRRQEADSERAPVQRRQAFPHSFNGPAGVEGAPGV